MSRSSRIHHVVALEQFDPAEAVRIAALADAAGFAGAVVSDRFQPWLPSQGNASFVWVVAGAIGQATGGEITVSAVPGYRMHPAVVAQASATLAALHPGRHRLLLSAGDAIDEHVVGGYWPEPRERAERLFEAGDVIRRLFSSAARGSDVRHSGDHFRLESSRLWSRGSPEVQVWAGGPATARRAGRTGQGIAVMAGPPERLAALLRAFREGAAEHRGQGRGRGRATVHAQVSWARTDGEAMENALRDWPMAGLRFPRGDIRSPFDVAQLAARVGPDDIRSRIPVSADIGVHVDRIRSLLDLGFDSVHLHNVGRNQEQWIERCAQDLLPAVEEGL
ncbi:TIGR03557 family F420-dependent LLM class oxidoreductase [Microbacterium soli]|uniref:TIGR03557 family F420-dependent LLM class oxidoreductase n=1 Tax=Microbacterium soli TaxID=446075 RepID=A0ABP7N6C1_9MICO